MHQLQTKDDSRIEPRRAPTARPRTVTMPGDLLAAARALVGIASRSPHPRQKRRANFLERGAGECRHPMCDAIVPMLCVPAEVSVEPVSHVQELLGDDHFERLRLRAIDAGQVDQDEMFIGCRRKRIGAANRTPQPSSQPNFEDSALGGDPEAICWQREESNVSFEMPARFLVID
jgi:hypothetical protein